MPDMVKQQEWFGLTVEKRLLLTHETRNDDQICTCTFNVRDMHMFPYIRFPYGYFWEPVPNAKKL